MALGINEATVSLISALDLQSLNNFEVIFYPSIINSGTAFLKSVVFDNVITKLHLQDITIPFGSITYERFGDDLFITGFERVEEITMKFVEDEFATVRTWVDSFRKDIFEYDERYGLILSSNQLASQRDCIISPLRGDGTPSPAIIKVDRLKYKSIGELSLSQANAEAMNIDVVFSCKNVDILTASDLLP